MIDRRSTPIPVVVAGFNPACDSGKSACRVWPQPDWSGQVWRRHAASQNRLLVSGTGAEYGLHALPFGLACLAAQPVDEFPQPRGQLPVFGGVVTGDPPGVKRIWRRVQRCAQLLADLVVSPLARQATPWR